MKQTRKTLLYYLTDMSKLKQFEHTETENRIFLSREWVCTTHTVIRAYKISAERNSKLKRPGVQIIGILCKYFYHKFKVRCEVYVDGLCPIVSRGIISSEVYEKICTNSLSIIKR